jgi:hypothetical protein
MNFMKFDQFMRQYAERVERGEIQLPCDVVAELLPEMVTAALAVEGGPHADDCAASEVRCCLPPRHRGLHYAVVRELSAGAVWLRWHGPVCELVELDDCAHEMNGGMDVCPLFARHRCSHR